MPVTIRITGENAEHVLSELRGMAAPLFSAVPTSASVQALMAVPGEERLAPMTAAHPSAPDDAETTKRKRRTKAEIEAAKAAEAVGTATAGPVTEESAEDLLGGGEEPYPLIDPEGGAYDSYSTATEWGSALLELVEAAKDESELKALSGNNRVGATRLQAEGHSDIIEQMKSAMTAKAQSFLAPSKTDEPELTFQVIYDAFVKLASVKGKGATAVRALLEKLGVPKLRDPQQKPLLPPEKFAQAWALVQVELKDA